MKKDWYKSKTLWIAVVQALAGIWAVVEMENPEVKTLGAVAIVKSAIDWYLRLNTSKAIK